MPSKKKKAPAKKKCEMRRLTKNEKRRLRKKRKRRSSALAAAHADGHREKKMPARGGPVASVIEFVAEPRPAAGTMVGGATGELARAFDRFCTPEQLARGSQTPPAELTSCNVGGDGRSDPPTSTADCGGGARHLTQQRRRALRRLTIAELKHLVRNPDVVEVHDATAADPRFLVYLKSCPNSVPVPRHWLQKRGYLQGKRGIDKQPFNLPRFIADTGISKVRDTVQAQDDDKTSKQRQRERVKPGTGKIEIDYQVLNDAFFKYQTKPKLTRHGDLYYEGKEFCEGNAQQSIPGFLSPDLKAALGMLPPAREARGEQTQKIAGHNTPAQVELPPPWLINMQRYGPPPSYPNLQIPGLTSPIPVNGAFGYHPGGWGKPPVDAKGHAVYGSQVFGKSTPPTQAQLHSPPCRWGEIASGAVVGGVGGDASIVGAIDSVGESGRCGSSDSSEAHSGSEVMSVADDDTARPAASKSGVDLRKGFNPGIDTPMSEALAQDTPADAPRHFAGPENKLYTVLEQKNVLTAGGAVLWHSTHAYEQRDGGDAVASARGVASSSANHDGSTVERTGINARAEVTVRQQQVKRKKTYKEEFTF